MFTKESIGELAKTIVLKRGLPPEGILITGAAAMVMEDKLQDCDNVVFAINEKNRLMIQTPKPDKRPTPSSNSASAIS